MATMEQGERALFVLAPEYAYGASGSPPKIPPHATLEFEVELLGWKSAGSLTPDGKVMFKVLDKADNEWRTPREPWHVLVRYEAKESSNGTVVESREPFNYAMGSKDGTFCLFRHFLNILDGSLPPFFDEALRKLKKGETGLLTVDAAYVPSKVDMEYTIELVNMMEVQDLLVEEEAGLLLKKTISEGEKWETPKDNCKITGISITAHVNKFNLPSLVTGTGHTVNGMNVFNCPEPKEFTLGSPELPEALNIALSQMKRKEQAEIRAHRSLGWGLAHTQEHNVPDQDLIFNVELLDFTKVKESWEMNTEEKLTDGLMLKQQGNAFFKDGKIRAAIKKYEKVSLNKPIL